MSYRACLNNYSKKAIKILLGKCQICELSVIEPFLSIDSANIAEEDHINHSGLCISPSQWRGSVCGFPLSLPRKSSKTCEHHVCLSPCLKKYGREWMRISLDNNFSHLQMVKLWLNTHIHYTHTQESFEPILLININTKFINIIFVNWIQQCRRKILCIMIRMNSPQKWKDPLLIN